MTCRQCTRPLTRRQISQGSIRCSHACANAAMRREYLPRWCERCRLPLTRRQLRDEQRFCSHRCAFLVVVPRRGNRSATPTQQAMLDILESNRDWWITYSDLAILLYGDDSQVALNTIRTTVSRLRQRGYRLGTRRIGWPTLERQYITAIRLADEPVVREVQAA